MHPVSGIFFLYPGGLFGVCLVGSQAERMMKLLGPVQQTYHKAQRDMMNDPSL